MQLLSTLVSTGTEYFTADHVRHVIKAGQITPIACLPIDFYNLLLNELKSDKQANKSLDQLGIKNEKDRVEKFFDCNYSAFGGDADVTSCGKLGDREVVNCKQRDSCVFEGKLCQLPNGLTRREAQVARAITKAKMDAEITADLFISQNTLRNHKNNIETKIGKNGKIAIAVWTEKVGLI